ncbi:DsrE family protein [uncultured Clostridium sp.]|uniref:DsrE family protein n=1 Tax=uncultured Clostridium sp. TaxID=59620 RepID=UPI0026021665|nr:DsrE family protein [uncultured Clostridium sp.]
MKLLIHVGEIDKWKTAIGNAKNAKKIKEDCEIEIVANSASVVALKEKIAGNLGLIDGFKELKDLNVKIKACNNSLKTFDLKKEELLEEVIIVKAAVIEIMEKQQEGYSYLRV